MKILELNFERGWRGGERQTIYNMKGFRNLGEETALICRKGSLLERRALDEKFNVFSYNNIFGVISFLISNGRKFDIIHAQTSHILTYCLVTKPFHKRKIIFSRRVDFVPKGKLTKFKYKSTDKLVAISTAVKDIVSKFSGRNDVEIISDIAITRELDKTRVSVELNRLGIEQSKHIIGTTAALVPHKDPLTMVEAINKLALTRKDFVFLHFGTGNLEIEVQKKIEEYNIQDQYKLMGNYNNVEDFFSVFEVFTMSSQEEGLGSSILDAFLYKVPVVTTNAGGIKDLVTKERGIVCNVQDFEAISNGIDDVLDYKSNAELTSNAYTYVQQYHSSEYVTKQYMKVMEMMLKS